jgi:hypothetical protein
MPEYLAPGVYVEEVSFRSKSIQGVPTSVTGFAGLTHYGPVQYDYGPPQDLKRPKPTEPRLVTSYAEFERVYGGLEPFADGLAGTLPPVRLADLPPSGRRQRRRVGIGGHPIADRVGCVFQGALAGGLRQRPGHRVGRPRR